MAAPQHSLGTHDRRLHVRAIRHKFFNGPLKFLRLHIVGVATKTGVSPPLVDRICSSLSKTPSAGMWRKTRPASFRLSANLSVLNCGLCRECGIVRTFTRRRISYARKKSVNSSIGLVEWPTVQIFGRGGMEQCGIERGESPRAGKGEDQSGGIFSGSISSSCSRPLAMCSVL